MNQLVFYFLSRTACRSPVARCPMPIRYSAAFSADTKQQAATLRNTRESKSRRLAKFRHNVRRCKGRSAPPYESCFQNDSVAHGCDLSCPSLTRRPPKVVSNGAVHPNVERAHQKYEATDLAIYNVQPMSRKHRHSYIATSFDCCCWLQGPTWSPPTSGPGGPSPSATSGASGSEKKWLSSDTIRTMPPGAASALIRLPPCALVAAVRPFLTKLLLP